MSGERNVQREEVFLHSFYVMTMPGLETLAFSEVREKLTDAQLVKFVRGIALFQSEARVEELLALRTIEDAFVTLAHIRGLRRGPDALKVLHSAIVNADMASALHLWSLVHGGKGPRTWRVVSQMSGSYDFRRIDAAQAVESALRKSLPRVMRQVEDEADVEIWCWLGGGDVLLGLRLSDASMRHRRYKREHLPASLRPTVAASMAWLARPTPQDIVLDPFCGAGTILIERALLAPFEREFGGDIRVEAVNMAERNAQAAHVNLSLQQWDAHQLPLEHASVNRIITNLPFGKQIGSREQNEELYRATMQQCAYVLAPGGLFVALTSEDRLLDRIVRDEGWNVTKKVVCVILGQPASIFVCEK
jgi:tRNA (guanine6-N2)-methyltransferase